MDKSLKTFIYNEIDRNPRFKQELTSFLGITNSYNLKRVECDIIKKVLVITNGNTVECCKLLGIGRRSFYVKTHNHNLSTKDYKPK